MKLRTARAGMATGVGLLFAGVWVSTLGVTAAGATATRYEAGPAGQSSSDNGYGNPVLGCVSGSWGNCGSDSGGDSLWMNNSGASITFITPANTVQLQIVGRKGQTAGGFVTIDGGASVQASEAGAVAYQVVVFDSGTLAAGVHTVVVSHPAGYGGQWVLDAWDVTLGVTPTTTTTTTSTTAAPTTTTTSTTPAPTTSTTQPINMDQTTTSFFSGGQALVAAAMVVGAGMSGLGVIVLHRFVAAASEAA